MTLWVVACSFVEGILNHKIKADPPHPREYLNICIRVLITDTDTHLRLTMRAAALWSDRQTQHWTDRHNTQTDTNTDGRVDGWTLPFPLPPYFTKPMRSINMIMFK